MNEQANWDLLFKEYRRIIKDRHFILFLRNFRFSHPKDHKILDVGCGDGGMMAFLIRSGYTCVQGLEPAFNLYNPSPYKHQIINESILDISKIRETYDVITLKGVLHHLKNVEEYKTALLNISNLLNVNGKVYCLEPWPTWFRPLATFALKSPLRYISQETIVLNRIHREEEKDINTWLKNCEETISFFKSLFVVEYESTDSIYKYICGKKISHRQ